MNRRATELSILLVAVLVSLSAAAPVAFACGVERWSVKTGTDPDAGLVNLSSSTPQTIATMRSWTAPNPIPTNSRVAPYETTQWVLNATLTEYKLETDEDYHLVIQDASGNTMIAEIPSPGCVGAGSPFAAGIQNARSEFDATYSATSSFQTANVPVQIKGVGMFDFLHGQTGVAPNGIEIHPVLDIVFNPGTTTSDFSVATSPSSLSLVQGTSGTSTITTSVIGGFNSSISLSASGLPSGATASFSPASIAAPGSGSATLTLGAGTAAAGSYPITVTATGGGTTHTAVVTLTVTASSGGGGGGTVPTNGNFETGSLSPWTATGVSSIISSGAHGGTYAAQLGSTSPSTDSTLAQTFTLPTNASQISLYVKITCPDTITYDWVTASLKDNTTGTTTTLLPNTCSNTGAWQNVTSSVSASAGHSVTLTLANHDDNYAGDATYSAWDDVTVSTSTATPSFSLSASPTSVTAAQGASATSTLTTTVAGGFNSSISFSASGVPSGATASFSPTSIAAPGSGSSTLTLAAGTAVAGTYTVTVTATGGGITHTAAITFSVTSSGGGGGAQQLIGNPGFENGSTNTAPWTTTSGVVDNSTSEPAHSGSWKAWMCGYGTTHTDSIVQTVAIPSGITTATLSFWLHIDTAETTTTSAYDTLQVQVRNSSGTVLATLATYSNLDAASGYTQKSFNVLAYAGQTVQVYLVGSEDSSNQTSFVVDDFALNVQ